MTRRRLPPGPGRRHHRGHRGPALLVKELATYGDIAYKRLGRQSFYVLSHPDLIRELLVSQDRAFMKGRALQEARRILGSGLLTSEGEQHLHQRRLIQPLFAGERIEGYAATMVEYAARAADRWRAGDTIEVGGEMARLTLAVVGKTLFDADVENEAPEVGEALTTAFEMLERFMTPWAPIKGRLPVPTTRRLNAARERLDAMIERLIEERREDLGGRTDLLSLLLEARDEQGAAMSRRQVRDEAMTIVLAGHETTAQALTWTWYLLSQNPSEEARVHAELEGILRGRPPSVGDLPSLTVTRAAVAESIRIYPPVWAMARRALRDVELGGYVIPKGAFVGISQLVVHHDPRWWPDPERFDLDRWTGEAETARPRFTYFPFGAGSRICIGERFAWMETILLLATIAQRWRLRLVPGHPITLAPRITLRPRHGMRMTVEGR